MRVRQRAQAQSLHVARRSPPARRAGPRFAPMSAPTSRSAWLLDTDDPLTDTASLLVGVIATLTLSVRIGQYLGERLARHMHAKKMRAASAPEGFEVNTGKEGGFVRKAKAE